MRSIVLVEMTRIELVSKKKSTKVSPGAARRLHSLAVPPSGRLHSLVASLVHDGPQSLSPFTCSAKLMPGSRRAESRVGQLP